MASGDLQDQLRRRVGREFAVVASVLVVMAALFVVFDVAERVAVFTGRFERFELDELVLWVAASHLIMGAFGYRRSLDLRRELDRREEAQRQVLHQASHDRLTGLPNRTWFTDRLREQEGSAEPCAVVYASLDRFTDVNEGLGQELGDGLLRAVAERLRGQVGDRAAVARLGGDEFAVLLRPAPDEQACLALAQRLLQAVRRPFEVAGLEIEVDGSFGVAHGADGSLGARLLQSAEAAMNVAKREHAGVKVHEPTRQVASSDRVALFGDLRRGIAAGELTLHYQPQVTVANGCVRVVEALVRWQHPERGLLPPGAFIEFAEHTALIRPLTMAVLRTAARDCRRLREQGVEITVAVNLSASLLHDETIAPAVLDILREHDLPTSALALEVTESAPMTDDRRALRLLQSLAAHGIRVAVDDFGTGHASLSYLGRLPVEVVKIDRSHVQAMTTDRTAAAIVSSVVGLAHRLGLRVVAEGVETREQWRHLQDLGCDDAQGFWLARPLPFEQLTRSVIELGNRADLRCDGDVGALTRGSQAS